jgi:soluble lytic murein transglycosylase-like protein
MRISRKAARWALVIALFVPLLILLTVGIALADVPREALRYQRDVTRNAHSVWGLEAPVAVFAAQIHQESRWNKDAKSAFAGGLAQFTPDTAAWISGAYPQSLGANQPYNPAWAMRALVTYDKQLYDQARADAPCDKMWKALWGYNGGMGWVVRDEKLAAKSGANIRIAKEVEPFNAGRALAMFKENRAYPRAILLKWQPTYALWGGEITCL